MEAPKAIHFPSSYLHWITHAEASHGCFQLDAVLNWYPPGHKNAHSYVLAAAVPAGRMYAESEPLLKQPPYSFQMIAGHLEHSIKRRALDHNQPNIPSDNTEPHNHTFKALSWELRTCLAKQVQPESLAAIPHPLPMLNIVIELEHNGGFCACRHPCATGTTEAIPLAGKSRQALCSGPLIWMLSQRKQAPDGLLLLGSMRMTPIVSP